jgi:hypothetical protein
MNATPSRPATTFTILGACLLLAVMMGCGKDNPVMPKNPGPKYPPSSTPQLTLESMAMAYSSRDSTGYDSLFDAAYAGVSFDPVSMVALNFTKADEAQHIAALARTHSIVSAVFQAPPNLVRERDGADPPGWATITVQNVLVEVTDNVNTLTIIPSETMEFKFAPTTPSLGSPTDTTWHIIRWIELP